MNAHVESNLARDPALADMARRLVKVYRPERVWLFGSRARGDHRPDSDYDFLVVVPDDAEGERKKGPIGRRALGKVEVGIGVTVMRCGTAVRDRKGELCIRETHHTRAEESDRQAAVPYITRVLPIRMFFRMMRQQRGARDG